MKYIVESALFLGMYNTAAPEEAVAAFIRDYEYTTERPVKVYVADLIGEFSKEVRIKRHPNPRITKPDSPHALTKAGPNNIK